MYVCVCVFGGEGGAVATAKTVGLWSRVKNNQTTHTYTHTHTHTHTNTKKHTYIYKYDIHTQTHERTYAHTQLLVAPGNPRKPLPFPHFCHSIAARDNLFPPFTSVIF